MKGIDKEIDQLDSREGRHDPAQTVNQEVAFEERPRAQRPKTDTPQGQGNKGNDDQGVENDRAQNGA